ncbi:hypothetical protein HDU81_003527 [Chytriomyces hyalinus]|nr:hypothetical protein HDU81_003527 [Chytriomyces hyalinus]
MRLFSTCLATRRSMGVAVGDLAQVRREPLLVVRAPTLDDPFFVSLASTGHSVRHSSRDVGFVSRSWAYSHKPSTETEIASKALGLDSDGQALLTAAELNPAVLDHLARFDGAVNRNMFTNRTRLAAIYPHFRDGKVRDLSIREAAEWAFGADPSPAELYATHSYLMRNPKWFNPIGGVLSAAVDAENARFSLQDETDVEDLVWIEKQAKGTKPGKELEAFLEKASILVNKASASVCDEGKSSENELMAQLEFSESDQRFIRAIQSAAYAPSTPYSQNPYTDLVNRGILSRLPCGYSNRPSFKSSNSGPTAAGRGSDALRLLKDLGVIAQWENASVAAAKGDSILDSVDGHGITDWADEAAEESKLWADRLLRESAPFYTTSTPSEPRTVGVDVKAPQSESLANAIRERTVAPLSDPTDSYPLQDAFESKRRDFGDMPVYVIDSPTAQELDDGISIEKTAEGIWMHAHIADPTAYLPPSHPLSVLAQLRGGSMYLPERHYPMLPDILSTARFNLGKSHCAMTFSCRLGSDGEIVDYKVAPSIIRNIKILHYRTVNQVLDWSQVYGMSKAPEDRMPWVNKALKELQMSVSNLPPAQQLDEKSAGELKDLQKLAYSHLQMRISRGGFSSDQPSLSVKVSPYPLPISPQSPKRPFEFSTSQPEPPLVMLDANQANHLEPSSNLVSECMILANRVASKFCVDNNLPAIYRGQNPLKPAGEHQAVVNEALDSVDPISGVMPYNHFRGILPFFSSASITTVPAPHFSLGIRGRSSPMVPSRPNHQSASDSNDFIGYMKVTSPLRRYKDMMLHWTMKNHLLGKRDVLFSQDTVLRLATRLHELEKRMDKVSNASEKFWALEWIRRREVLWRSGAAEDMVYAGVKPALDGVGIAMPSDATGKYVVWSDDYRRNCEWGLPRGAQWEVSMSNRCLRPVYQFVLNSNQGSSKFGLGILGDLGGVFARVELKTRRFPGEVFSCVVDTVDPAAGVLVVKEL